MATKTKTTSKIMLAVVTIVLMGVFMALFGIGYTYYKVKIQHVTTLNQNTNVK